MARIESDQRGADDNLYVEFYSKPVKNEFQSQEQGRPIFEDVTYVKIHTPSDQLTVIDTPVREDHKARFPRQWAFFMNTHGNDQKVIGTPVTQWPLLTPAQAEELKGMKFNTVELLANANDQQLQKLGMLAGISGYSLREKARAFLNLAQDSAHEAKREEEMRILREELAKKDEETAKIKAETDAKLAEMQAKMQAQMESLLAAVGEKKTKSRKAKTEVEES